MKIFKSIKHCEDRKNSDRHYRKNYARYKKREAIEEGLDDRDLEIEEWFEEIKWWNYRFGNHEYEYEESFW